MPPRRPNSGSSGRGAGAARPSRASTSATSAKPSAKAAPKPAADKAPAAKVGALSVTRLDSKRQQKRSQRTEARSQSSSVRSQLGEIKKLTKGSKLKRGIIFTSLGSVVALVTLVLATIFTPLMSIDKIEIVGLHRMKQATVENAVKSLIGTPLTTVDENQIQQRLKGFPLIESFTTVSLPPHTLQIYIRERQPIGLVTIGATDYLYDPAGVQISPTNSRSKYPLILVSGNPAHSSSFREAVSVLLALPATLYPKVASIQATSVDDVRIHLRGNANTQILWGDSSKSLLKSKVLKALLATVKRRQLVVFDVSSPNAPTVRFGSF
ncbi:MAG: hypothetical protein RJA35_527 [Actinomycetota bacterium]